MAFTSAFNTPPLVPDFSSCWIFFFPSIATLPLVIFPHWEMITLEIGSRIRARVRPLSAVTEYCYRALSPVSKHFDSISNSSGRPVPHSKNLDWPNGLWKHQVGWEKGNEQWFFFFKGEGINGPEGKRTKTTGLYKVKDGHPTFLFFHPFQSPSGPFFRAVLSTSHWHFVWPKSNQTPTVTFFTPHSSSFNLKKLKDAAAR